MKESRAKAAMEPNTAPMITEVEFEGVFSYAREAFIQGSSVSIEVAEQARMRVVV